jgi:hypothetical protein
LFAQGYLLCHYPRFYSRSAVDIPIGEAKGRSGAVVSRLRLYRIPVLPQKVKCKNHHRCYQQNVN